MPHASRSKSSSASSSRSNSRSLSESQSRSRSRSRSKSGSEDSRSSYRNGDRDRPKPNKCIGVFNLDTGVDERELRNLFGRDKFGEIENIQIIKDHHTGRSKGYAFIYYKTINQAEKARNEMTGTIVSGKSIRVDFSITDAAHSPTPGNYKGSRHSSDIEPNRCLGIFNLHHTTDKDKLYQKFQKFGSIEDTKVIYDHHTGESRGFGFVYYKRTRDALEAKKVMNDAVITGKHIRVDFSRNKVERDRSPRRRRRSRSYERDYRSYSRRSPPRRYRSRGRY